jgi:hypothetical protein
MGSAFVRNQRLPFADDATSEPKPTIDRVCVYFGYHASPGVRMATKKRPVPGVLRQLRYLRLGKLGGMLIHRGADVNICLIHIGHH